MKFPVVSIGEKTEGGQNALLTPLLQEGQLRIVLSWGSQPSDLDSHLVTPTIEGNSYHILYNSKGVSNRAPYVQLDVDDTSSYGPETTTVYARYPGKYYYYVHNFSEKGNSNSQGLTTSGAKVDVYSDKGLVKSYNVLLSGTGTYWQVFSYDGTTGEIETINNWFGRYHHAHRRQVVRRGWTNIL
ncbi:MAG: hypothetical protein BWK78_07210 [Thiotrichaceae bacterium IS1]|nr:MAG: hypothetical protein BWK78_07210 [Thiotrichaceae bacterium IS1]